MLEVASGVGAHGQRVALPFIGAVTHPRQEHHPLAQRVPELPFVVIADAVVTANCGSRRRVGMGSVNGRARQSVES